MKQQRNSEMAICWWNRGNTQMNGNKDKEHLFKSGSEHHSVSYIHYYFTTNREGSLHTQFSLWQSFGKAKKMIPSYWGALPYL